MVTIKDIARQAGVAHGTVSNVLNGKGNVSSEKIKQVMDAALSLGYVPNERAKFLRKGHTNLLGVILPNIRSKQYVDFYLSFKHYAESHDYNVLLQLTNDDNQDAEINSVQQIRSYMACGIAAISSFNDAGDTNPYIPDNNSLANTEKCLFVERKTSFSNFFIGFDYEKAGMELAQKAIENNYTSICLLTASLSLPNEADFYRGFMRVMSGNVCTVKHVQTDMYRRLQNIMQIFNSNHPQAVFISNYGFAESVKDVYSTFYDTTKLPIYTVSPLFTLPENDFVKYELNYRRLGSIAAETLIDSIQNPSKEFAPQLLESSGFLNWNANIIANTSKQPLNILTLDNPSSYTMRYLSRLYTQKTGTPIHVTIYAYDEIYEAFNSMRDDSVFDIIRLDVTWLSWFAEKILQPLDGIDPGIREDMNSFIPDLIERYSIVNGHIYCLPVTPSMQLLFYRKDLFESPIYKRMYWETYRKQLTVPNTFEDFNKIARFFTKAINPESPVDFGATLTLGSTGVASSEYLARLFSYQDNLYDNTN